MSHYFGRNPPADPAEKCRSQPVSRILSAGATTPRGVSARQDDHSSSPAITHRSSNLPGGFGRAALKRHPIWSCSVRGFACHPCCHERGALLPHLFTLTRHNAKALRRAVSFLCHCSVRFPCPGVTRRTALRSSDFPPAPAVGLAARARAGGRLAGCDSQIIAYRSRFSLLSSRFVFKFT